jgi:NADH-ubiquinone oxidoreductase chain 1
MMMVMRSAYHVSYPPSNLKVTDSAMEARRIMKVTNIIKINMKNILFNLLEVLIVIVPVLLAVAFMTIIERKQLAAMQRRVGPNTVGYYGVLQPFSDALKLILKETIIPGQSNKVLFYLAPVFTLIFSLLG